MTSATLLLRNGLSFTGQAFGYPGIYYGELVFNTAMSGYVEALTDPSYQDQILTFAYPLIGNYGTTLSWSESKKIYPQAVVISQLCRQPYHRFNHRSLNLLLKRYQVGGIADIDTRDLVKIIRRQGTIDAVLAVKRPVPSLSQLKHHSSRTDQVIRASRKRMTIFNPQGKPAVALIDYGLKRSILRQLVTRRLKVIVFPARSRIQQILKHQPQGIVLSNGPGNPSSVPFATQVITQLLDSNLPIFGICLGHQILAQAAGAQTFKLKYGHRGLNQPVIDLKTRRAYLTSQNHGYAVSARSLPSHWRVTFINLNDQTVEGLEHTTKPLFSVQFHPEASPGPADTNYLFDHFCQIL